MREGAGRRSSALDRIRPTVWPAAFTEELLRLLWIIENTVALQPALGGRASPSEAVALPREFELLSPRREVCRPQQLSVHGEE